MSLMQQLDQLNKKIATLEKKGFLAAGAPMPANPNAMPPMDPSMMGGGTPMPPMDPSMMGGGTPMPPMDPSMMGGMPPMDPSMMGMGAPGEAPMENMVTLNLDDLRQILAEAGGKTPEEKPEEKKETSGDSASLEAKVDDLSAKFDELLNMIAIMMSPMGGGGMPPMDQGGELPLNIPQGPEGQLAGMSPDEFGLGQETPRLISGPGTDSTNSQLLRAIQSNMG